MHPHSARSLRHRKRFQMYRCDWPCWYVPQTKCLLLRNYRWLESLPSAQTCPACHAQCGSVEQLIRSLRRRKRCWMYRRLDLWRSDPDTTDPRLDGSRWLGRLPIDERRCLHSSRAQHKRLAQLASRLLQLLLRAMFHQPHRLELNYLYNND